MSKIKISHKNGIVYRYEADYHFDKNVLVVEDKSNDETLYFNFNEIEYFVINGCNNKESEVH